MKDICDDIKAPCAKRNDGDAEVITRISTLIKGCQRVCDIGFGNTTLAEILLQECPSIFYCGIDINRTCVDEAKKNISKGNIRFYTGRMTEIKLPQFDCFVISRVIHHMTATDLDATLRDVIYNLNGNGKLVIVDSIRDFSNRANHYLYLPFYILAQTYKYLSSYELICRCVGNIAINKYWVILLDISENRASYLLEFID